MERNTIKYKQNVNTRKERQEQTYVYLRESKIIFRRKGMDDKKIWTADQNVDPSNRVYDRVSEISGYAPYFYGSLLLRSV